MSDTPNYLMTSDRTRWQVLWMKPRKGKAHAVVKKDFEHDLASATSLYVKAVEAGKPFATLRCCNVGFPPPDKYHPYDKTIKRATGKTKVVKRRTASGKIKRVRVKLYKTEEVHVVPMETVNLKGIWWCPYCMKMRRFEKLNGFRSEGIYVAREGMHCPICKISHRNYIVRRWNPQAERMEFKLGQKRVRKSTTSRRRRRAR